jgi:hypothetical protein
MKARPAPRGKRYVLIALGFGTDVSGVPLPSPPAVARGAVLHERAKETVVSPRRELDSVES